MTLTIVGLGPGNVDDLSRRAWRALKNARTVYLRTAQHGCVACLPQTETSYVSFDDLYETIERFEDVYTAIVGRVLDAARAGDTVYAVPGDPLMGESTVVQLLAQAKEAGIPVEIVSGISFVEPTMALLGVDAMNGLQVLDGLAVAAMHHPPINPDYPALLGQVYSRHVASEVKLTLMNQYPEDFAVTLVHDAGTENARLEHLPLHDIDHSDHIRHTTALYIPALGGMSSFEQFQEVIAHLRAPEGCPWDREQTHLSLRKYLIEEAYEVLETLDNEDPRALAEEMGDLLLQIVLHTQIATDDGEFRMADVISHINRKLIHRHPHVWGTTEVSGAAEVLQNWDALKKQEHAAKGVQRESLLDGVPKGLPALMQANEYRRKAAKIGFDWANADDAKVKLHEEIDEVTEAKDDPEHLREEIGDFLFMAVNWAAKLGIDDSEGALREANAKFYRRFRHIEQSVKASGRPADSFTLDELEAFWQEAKRKGL
jgi:tetrapyrrole methylase family protein/MazG family protein